MTVAKLIEELEKVEDKTISIGFHSYIAKAGYRAITDARLQTVACLDKPKQLVILYSL